jgi:hypothetical protein
MTTAPNERITDPEWGTQVYATLAEAEVAKAESDQRVQELLNKVPARETSKAVQPKRHLPS